MHRKRQDIFDSIYHDVFLSYDHQHEGDFKTASQLAVALELAGYSVWWDRSLIAGDHWPTVIKKKCRSALRVVALITQRSVTRAWCKLEWQIGAAAGTLVPIKLEPCDMPTDIRTAVASIQCATLCPGSPEFAKSVITALKLPPSSVPAARALQQPTHSNPSKIHNPESVNEIYFSYLMSLLRTKNDPLVKIAAQDLCSKLESGFALNDRQKFIVSETFETLWEQSTYKTRNWIVKAAGLCKLRSLSNRIETMFNHSSTDEETRSWLLASYYKIFDAERAIALMKNGDAYSPTYSMALQFYSKTDLRVLDPISITKAIDANPVTAKWACFFHGYNHAASSSLTGFAATEVVGDLTSHHDDSVVEHALWSLHRARNGSIQNNKLSLGNIDTHSSNIRRRLYILAGKDDSTFPRYISFLSYRIQLENDSYAREGLAASIAATHRYISQLDPVIADWFTSEKDDVVRMAMLPHIMVHANCSTRYESLLQIFFNNDNSTSLLTLRYRAIAAMLPPSSIAARLMNVHQSKLQ